MSKVRDSPPVSNKKPAYHKRTCSKSESTDVDTVNAVLKQRVELLQSELEELRERELVKATINDKMIRAFKGTYRLYRFITNSVLQVLGFS